MRLLSAVYFDFVTQSLRQQVEGRSIESGSGPELGNAPQNAPQEPAPPPQDIAGTVVAQDGGSQVDNDVEWDELIAASAAIDIDACFPN